MEVREKLGQAARLLALVRAGGGGDGLQIGADDGADLTFERRTLKVRGEFLPFRMGLQARNQNFGKHTPANRDPQPLRTAENGDYPNTQCEIRTRKCRHGRVSSVLPLTLLLN